MANKPAKTRMCVSCRKAHGQEEMIRLVRTPEGIVRLDAGSRENGRGAYICKNRACIEKAKLERRVERALSCPVPAEIYTELGDTYA